MRLGLVKYLTGVPHIEATRALAKLAIFSSEEDVRLAAIESLKVRREKDYTDILVKGLRYPWPAVAKRAADAIGRMERTDLIPELVAVLAQDDPRLPVIHEKEGKKVSTVREMVKINHHRNCMMCHAPGNPSTGSANAMTAEVPVMGQPLPSPLEGYRQSSPDLMIRIDVTYLRQDFSALLPVADAQPWPECSGFDFFVRERKLTDEEAGPLSREAHAEGSRRAVALSQGGTRSATGVDREGHHPHRRSLAQTARRESPGRYDWPGPAKGGRLRPVARGECRSRRP